MSADKDRAIRRQKQKRAKDVKKQGKLAPQPAVVQSGSTKAAAKPKTA